MTDAKIAALRAETAELKNREKRLAIDMVKQAKEHQQRLAEAKQTGEDLKLIADMKKVGLRFV